MQELEALARPSPVDVSGTPRRPEGRGTDSLACERVMRPLAWKLPRKEVIQPQLPLRLPCYDFVPITRPTLDGCLPEGLAHRLQVLPAFMT